MELKHKAHNCHWTLVEEKASGKSAVQEMQRINIPVKGVQVNRDKIARANQSTPPFESGNVYFPYAEYTDRIIAQLTGFPNTKNDDIVDSITQFINWARENTSSMPIVVSSGKRKTKTILRGYNG